MRALVVAHDDFTRTGARLVATLQHAHEAELWYYSRFEKHLSAVRAFDRAIFIGETPHTLTLRKMVEPGYDQHGIFWGFRSKNAVIVAVAPHTPKVALDRIQHEYLAVVKECERQRERMKRKGITEITTGPQLAATFLDPDLRVDEMTVMKGDVRFTPQRMLWERQYTLGIATFLLRAYDEYWDRPNA